MALPLIDGSPGNDPTRNRRNWQIIGKIIFDGAMAGAGLTSSGGVLAVGDGAGILVSADSIEVELATNPGLEFDAGGAAGKLRAKVGNGLELTSSGIEVDLAAVNPGLAFSGGDLIVDPGDGIELTSAGVSINLGTTSGLVLTAGELFVDPGDGIELTGGGVAVNLGTTSGLEITGGELFVNPGDGIELTAGGVAVNLATTSGLLFTGGELAVDPGDGIEVVAGGVAVDLVEVAGDPASGLEFSGGDLRVKTDSGAFGIEIRSDFGNEGTLAVFVDPDGGLEVGATGVDASKMRRDLFAFGYMFGGV